MSNRAPHRPVLIWLIVLYVSIMLMVVIGGITRLTGSGLSMVDWHPLMGALPPLTEEAWLAVFARYQESPQYELVNHWMTLDDFKLIFFWEYIHRLMGRLIGVIFALPWVVFLVRKQLTGGLAWRSAIAFLLGGAQGLLGWYMVKSGLVDVPEVSHYRLAAHLMLAVVVAMYIQWLILDLRPDDARPAADRAMRWVGWGLVGLISIQIVWGAFMAGARAGYLFSTFPDMNDAFAPPGMNTLTPWWRNALDNPIAIHFTHRLLAWIATLACIGGWWFARKRATSPRQVWALRGLLVASILQFATGAATVMTYVWVPIAVVHQLGGVLLLSVAVYCAHAFSGRRGLSPGA